MPATEHEVPSNGDGPVNKVQKLPSHPPSRSRQAVIEGNEHGSNPDTDTGRKSLAEASQDYFSLPSDFLQEFLLENELQDSEAFIADLNLDQYINDTTLPSETSFVAENLGTKNLSLYLSLTSDHAIGSPYTVNDRFSSDANGLSQSKSLLLPADSGLFEPNQTPADGVVIENDGDKDHLPKYDQSRQLESPCRCLEIVGKLLTETESKSLETDTGAVDMKLTWQKGFLQRCNTVLDCPNCLARPEYLLLLGFLTQNLTNYIEATVNMYLEDIQSQPRPSSTKSPSTSSERSSKAHLGQYEVESPREWSTLMKVLIILQLQSVQKLLRSMKEASHMESNAMLPQIQWPCPTERRVMRFIDKLGQPT